MIVIEMNEGCWRYWIAKEMATQGETRKDIISYTLTEEELDIPFDDGYGGTEGKPFTLWTKNRVYFPVQYDGAEWVDSVPRNPCDEATKHLG